MFSDHQRKIAKLKGLDYLVIGLIGQILGFILWVASLDNQDAPIRIGDLMLVLATGVLVAGCGNYARYYRMSRWWGLLGILNVIGVAALFALRLRRRDRKWAGGFDVEFAEPYRRDVWRMDIHVKLLAGEPIMLQLPRGANVGTAMKTLAGVIPELEERDWSGCFSINGQPADRRTELSNGDELIVTAPAQPPGQECRF
jgi:hypothetical protein